MLKIIVILYAFTSFTYLMAFDLDRYFSHIFMVKCDNVTYVDLMQNRIIENVDELKNVLYLNRITNSKDKSNRCLVVNLYKSHFIKNEVDPERKLLEVTILDSEIKYSFDSNCKYITKQNLIDNFVIKNSEYDRNLSYCGTKSSTCDIFKKK